MGSRYPVFDRSRLRLRPLSERCHDVRLDALMPLDAPVDWDDQKLPRLAGRLAAARHRGAARVLMMGAHVIKSGASLHIIDLLERDVFTHVAINGACMIHDYELASIGATSESVARYIRTGEFGMWSETGALNDWARDAAALGLGLGENAGRRLCASSFPHASILATAYRLGVPATVHAGIGYDIIHAHPNCDGGALGAASYQDFLIFARSLESLEGGVVVSFGSAVMAPEVYLKALSMVRNVARQEGREICDFTTAVFDLVPIEGDWTRELPKADPGYYFRPHKTMLARTVADGGTSFYFRGDHRLTVPALRAAMID